MLQLQYLYIVSAAVGFIYVVAGAVLGQFGEGDGHHGEIGHDHDFGHGHDPGHGHHHDAQAMGKTMQSNYLVHNRPENDQILRVLRFLSPMSIAIFCFWFGIIGYISLRAIPIIGYLSLVLAFILSLLCTRIIRRAFSLILRRSHVSTNFREEDIIGSAGELTVSIPQGRMGEITYVANGARHTAACKARDTSLEIPKAAKVMIVDIADGIIYVEAWKE